MRPDLSISFCPVWKKRNAFPWTWTSSTSSGTTPLDTDRVKNIFNSIHPLACPGLRTARLGKRSDNRPRLVRATLSSKSDVLAILWNKTKYKDPVRIFQDSTPRQQQYLSSLRTELKSLVDASVTDKTIRYINGTPKIVNVSRPSSKKNKLITLYYITKMPAVWNQIIWTSLFARDSGRLVWYNYYYWDVAA